MVSSNTAPWALLTFALYDETPIACQGDDDRDRIRVITARLRMGGDVQARAVRVALALERLHGGHAQLWALQLPQDDKRLAT